MITVYHRCATFATGAAMEHGEFVLWWAERADGAWGFRFVGAGLAERHELEARIRAAARLNETPALAAAAAQDARAEAPDL